jgi:hypothetical protein
MERDELGSRLKATLHEDDRALLQELDTEPGMFQMMGGVMRGRMRRWVVLMMVFALVIQGVFFWSAYKLFTAETALIAMQWGVVTLWCGMAVAAIKIWYWMEMNKYAMLREIKRVEVQIARRSPAGDDPRG